MKRGTLSLRHGTRQQRRKKTHLGARRRYRRKELGGAPATPQEGAWGAQRRWKRLGGGRDDATAGRIYYAAATPQKTSRGTAWAIRSRTSTRTGQKRRPMAPNRARIWRANEKEPDLLQFSPSSRNRAKVSTALSRHYAEGPDGYTRRVLLKLQQIAIRCIRQGGTGAR